MRRIIYSSRATRSFEPDELTQLLEVARAHNERDGLTGMLVHASHSFLQALEGDPEAVERTYGRIRADERHSHLTLLMDADVPAALFPDWSMGFDHLDDEELADRLPGYTPATVYPLVNPDLITNGTVAETMLSLYRKNRIT